MDRFVIIFSSLFVVVSCASPASLPPAPPPAAAPSSVASTSASPPPAAFDPKTWLAREVASGLTDAPFEIASPAVRGTVPSSAAPTLSEKSGHQVLSIPIGTQAPIECTFYSTAIDVAAYVTQVTRGTSTKLEIITTSVTEVGVEHESPTMRASFEYLAARPEGGKGAGLLKVAVQSSDAGVIGCMHDEYGYRDTFQRITKALFASRAYAKEPPVVPYETITRIDVNGAATGYARRVFQPVEGGSLQVRDYMAAVFVAAGRMLLAMDYAGVTVTDARGEIVSETFASGEQGALEHQIVVKRTRTDQIALSE